MSFSGATRIKARNRNAVGQVKKSSTNAGIVPTNRALSSPVTSLPVAESTIMTSQNLHQEILSRLNPHAFQSNTHDPRKPTHRISLAASYRSQHIPASHVSTRRTRDGGQRDALLTGGRRHSSSHHVSTQPSTASGRISHLASRVESLALQEVSLHPVREHQTTCAVPSGSITNGQSIFTRESTSQQQNRYRPRAPRPAAAVTPPSRSEDESSISHNHHLSHLQPTMTPCYRHATIKQSGKTMEFVPEILGCLERDDDFQDFLLPPPPPLFTMSSSSDVENDVISDEDSEVLAHPFPSPPPSPTSVTTTGRQRDSAIVSATLGPLTSITNILSNPSICGTRQPKWSINGSMPRNRLPFTHRSSRLTTEAFGSAVATPSPLDSDSDSMTSPPPLIVERVPPVLDSMDCDRLEDPETLSLPVDCAAYTTMMMMMDRRSSLARPTVLKRGAPDGAEQLSSPSATETMEGKSSSPDDKAGTLLPLVSKRCSTPNSMTTDYSPKKSRTRLLVPSERSAFLPVGSGFSLPHSTHISPSPKTTFV